MSLHNDYDSDSTSSSLRILLNLKPFERQTKPCPVQKPKIYNLKSVVEDVEEDTPSLHNKMIKTRTLSIQQDVNVDVSKKDTKKRGRKTSSILTSSKKCITRSSTKK